MIALPDVLTFLNRCKTQTKWFTPWQALLHQTWLKHSNITGSNNQTQDVRNFNSVRKYKRSCWQ